MTTQNNNPNSDGSRTLVPGRPWLKPFQPGQSGNPGGRPKNAGLSAMIREKTKDGAELVQYLMDVISGREPRARVADRIEACRLLLDRGWGKPVQTTEISGPGGGPVQTEHLALVSSLDNETLRRLVELRDEVLSLAPGQVVDADPTIPGGDAPAS